MRCLDVRYHVPTLAEVEQAERDREALEAAERQLAKSAARRASIRARWQRDHYVFSDGAGIGPATCAIADLERERQKGRVHRGE
jgi:hypothetical protein